MRRSEVSSAGRAKIALEDGFVREEMSIGAPGERVGEVVFDTSLSGCPEVFTDPSYCRRIVAMTDPHIGDDGVDPEGIPRVIEAFRALPEEAA